MMLASQKKKKKEKREKEREEIENFQMEVIRLHRYRIRSSV